ncbi:MAG: response regulator [Methanoregula sp.]|nr:response regulator [Methanoregula sp.]
MPSLLIVEDEAIVANDIKDTLIGQGYTVVGTAKTGKTALEKVSETNPDIVLMDIHLAGAMDGIEAAGAIHAKHGIPVIFLTAYADTALLQRAKVTEPYGYILKPYDERELYSVIEMALYKHRMEKRLQESEATTRMMVNATQDLLYLLSADGKFLVANEALAEFVGMTPDELSGTNVYDLVGKKILSPRMACWQLDPRGEKRLNYVEQWNRCWYEVTIYPLYDDKGSAVKFAVSVRNITAQKQVEDQVKNNAEYFRQLIEDASEIVIMLNPDGTFSQQSPSFKHALGYPTDEDLKKSFFDHISINDWQQAKQVLAEILVHPGMAKPIRLKFEKYDGSFCIIKGIMCNMSHNPFVGRVVLNGWME